MFFDLNLAVDGVGDQSRREMVAMAMQLGYTGIAANHIFTGVMADSNRCKIRPLELKMILSAAPAVAEAARFHRDLLSVPHGLPFRQFTRITVVVENPSQANALNSGNPVLKTYDIVAVRPTNQKAFNQACSHAEVDMISLDLGQKLPFRMKIPVVKAATERGIFFEISYGRTIFDSKARRELYANAQMLLAAARGRNVIVSSGARRALEMRGPNDAANMSTLFGLNLESAKAAVSHNCKAVLMHGVMRKSTYRGAIHIAQSVVTENALDSENFFNVPMDWDPLSLGGASADFIPMDDHPDVASKDSPGSTAGVTEERITSALSVGDSGPFVASSKAAVQNFVVEKEPEMHQQEEKAAQVKNEGDIMFGVDQESGLPIAQAGGPGVLGIDSVVRHPEEASATAENENLRHRPEIAVGKRDLIAQAGGLQIDSSLRDPAQASAIGEKEEMQNRPEFRVGELDLLIPQTEKSPTYSSVRGPVEASGIDKKENLQHRPMIVGKQPIRDNMPKVEPNVERLGPKKDKKRKRKK